MHQAFETGMGLVIFANVLSLRCERRECEGNVRGRDLAPGARWRGRKNELGPPIRKEYCHCSCRPMISKLNENMWQNAGQGIEMKPIN